jgi:hypothetical protein
MTEQELAQAIEQARQERIKAFSDEVKMIAEKYGCDLIARPYIAEDGVIKCTIQVVATR